ncbi:MAG: 4Fe-4S binding protein, partial [Castellaniella sp.]
LAGVHKLAQGLIPAAGAGVFLGLSATTLTLLQHEGVPIGWANAVRFTLLALALAWSLRFEWRLAGLRTLRPLRRLGAVTLVAVGLLPFCWAWVLFFVRW